MDAVVFRNNLNYENRDTASIIFKFEPFMLWTTPARKTMLTNGVGNVENVLQSISKLKNYKEYL